MAKITRTVHYGTYGRLYTVDEDGNELEIKKETQKRGRGRPRKDEGVKFHIGPLLYRAFGLPC
jgi:hypothetical protein